MNKFPCTGCGVCCTKVGLAVTNAKQMISDGEKDLYVAEVAAFPHQYKENGNCEHLNEDHTCAVYLNRPDVCKVEVMWEKYHKDNITRDNYFISTAILCNHLIKDAATDDNFFINVENMVNEQSGATAAAVS